MRSWLKNIIDMVIDFIAIVCAIFCAFKAFDTAKWFYSLKSGFIYDFLYFMSLENSIVLAILIFILSLFLYAFICFFILGIISLILGFIIDNLFVILSVSFLGLIAFPFLFVYVFVYKLLQHIYVIFKFSDEIHELKYLRLYSLTFIFALIVLAFCFFYYDLHTYLLTMFNDLKMHILTMKRFDYQLFAIFMLYAFILNIISFIFLFFFNKMNSIIYITIYEYYERYNSYKDTKGYSHEYNKYEEKSQEQEKTTNSTKYNKFTIACELFSINPKKFDEISLDELKKRYRKLAKAFHPDLHINNKGQMEKKMKEINGAYEYLKNIKEKR